LYVKKSFEDSDDTYGYRRVHTDLADWGVPAGPELVRSLMRELGLEPCQPRPWRISLTEGDGQEHDIPDLVDRDFTADAPGAENGRRHHVSRHGRAGFSWPPSSTAIQRR
jgi:putative transposase